VHHDDIESGIVSFTLLGISKSTFSERPDETTHGQGRYRHRYEFFNGAEIEWPNSTGCGDPTKGRRLIVLFKLRNKGIAVCALAR
jgi:hypothetical protein